MRCYRTLTFIRTWRNHGYPATNGTREPGEGVGADEPGADVLAGGLVSTSWLLGITTLDRNGGL
jgi:hypothetical protein